jgi:2Fe-2S ferredoxin
MPIIIIENLSQKQISYSSLSQSVLKHIQEAHIDWMQACGGKGRCTTCAMQVIQGAEFLTPMTALENKLFEAKRLRNDERLACQCITSGDLIIKVPRRNQLPHLQYSNEKTV